MVLLKVNRVYGLVFFPLALLLHLEFISHPSYQEQRTKHRQNFVASPIMTVISITSYGNCNIP